MLNFAKPNEKQWLVAAFIPGYSGGTAAAFTAFRSSESGLCSIDISRQQKRQGIFNGHSVIIRFRTTNRVYK